MKVSYEESLANSFGLQRSLLELERFFIHQLSAFGGIQEHLRNTDMCPDSMVAERSSVQPSTKFYRIIVGNITKIPIPEEPSEAMIQISAIHLIVKRLAPRRTASDL